LREREIGDRVDAGTKPGGGWRESQAMTIPQPRQWGSKAGEMAWLSALTAAMHDASRPELRAVRCDAAVLKAVRAHLARPSIQHGLYGSRFSFRN